MKKLFSTAIMIIFAMTLLAICATAQPTSTTAAQLTTVLNAMHEGSGNGRFIAVGWDGMMYADWVKRWQSLFRETTPLRAITKSADVKRCQRSWREEKYD
jgi:ABC-type glycerol-3-phosphate transport system substrate-binding protein